jgi:hypothetical protein
VACPPQSWMRVDTGFGCVVEIMKCKTMQFEVPTAVTQFVGFKIRRMSFISK